MKKLKRCIERRGTESRARVADWALALALLFFIAPAGLKCEPARDNFPTGQDMPPDALFSESWIADASGLLLVVDRKTALPEGYVPADLVSLTSEGIPADPPTLKARRVIVADLKKMFADGLKDGFEFFVFSAYRSFHTQVALYRRWVKILGEKEADRSSAKAGHSEHQLGTTLDISVRGLKGDVFETFQDTAAARWLAENAHRYGFVMSYPEGAEEESGYMYEPWHFRYVGQEAAAYIVRAKMIPSVFIRRLQEGRERRNTPAP